MAKFDLLLPTIQNWNCHNCGGCCRQHVIEITPQEKDRIERQGWDQDPATQDSPVILSDGKTHRLAHRPDGACVFLDPNGLCRIHARYGEPAKPLACRVYPYAFHPAGEDVAVSLRFSCPSVVENKGLALDKQLGELNKIAHKVVTGNHRDFKAPLIRPGQQTNWDDFLEIVDMLDAVLQEEPPVLIAVLRLLSIADLLEEASFEKITGDRLTEFLQLIAQTALLSVSELPSAPSSRPRSIAQRHLRMLVAQYVRQDTMADLDSGLRGYWARFKTSLRFTRGKGDIPSDRPELPTVDFAAVEEPFAIADSETIDEMLRRYFRVKIQGIHFCGSAYYDAPLVEGLRSLLLVWPSVMWVARWHAAGQNRRQIDATDVGLALAVVDHNHGYSEAFGLKPARLRVRLLARMNQISPLCLWYSRTP